MTRRLTEEKRDRIFRAWMAGLGNTEIEDLGWAKKATVTKIVKEKQREFPDVDLYELRDLNIRLRENNRTVAECDKALDYLDGLEELNLDNEDVKRATDLLSPYGEDAPRVLEEAGKLEEICNRYNLSYDTVYDQYQKMWNKHQDFQTRVKALEIEEQRLKGIIRNLLRLELLQGKLDSCGIPIETLNGFLDNALRLQELGFSLNVAKLLAIELQKTGHNPETAAKEVVRLLAAYDSLARAVEVQERAKAYCEKTLQYYDTTIPLKKKELSDLETAVQKEDELYKQRVKDIENAVETKYIVLLNEHESKFRKQKQTYEDELEALRKDIQRERNRRDILGNKNEIVASFTLLLEHGQPDPSALDRLAAYFSFLVKAKNWNKGTLPPQRMREAQDTIINLGKQLVYPGLVLKSDVERAQREKTKFEQAYKDVCKKLEDSYKNVHTLQSLADLGYRVAEKTILFFVKSNGFAYWWCDKCQITHLENHSKRHSASLKDNDFIVVLCPKSKDKKTLTLIDIYMEIAKQFLGVMKEHPGGSFGEPHVKL